VPTLDFDIMRERLPILQRAGKERRKKDKHIELLAISRTALFYEHELLKKLNIANIPQVNIRP